MDAEAIAKGLSEAQRRYIRVVGEAPEPYTPRHGVTANWALRHKYADTVVRLNDGREGGWQAFEMDDRMATGIDAMLGQRLTPLGQAVRDALLKDRNA